MSSCVRRPCVCAIKQLKPAKWSLTIPYWITTIHSIICRTSPSPPPPLVDCGGMVTDSHIRMYVLVELSYLLSAPHGTHLVQIMRWYDVVFYLLLAKLSSLNVQCSALVRQCRYVYGSWYTPPISVINQDTAVNWVLTVIMFSNNPSLEQSYIDGKQVQV